MRGSWAVAPLLAAALLGGCETATWGGQVDAGVEDAPADAVVDASPGPQFDAGPWGVRGVRVTAFLVERPFRTFECDPNPCEEPVAGPPWMLLRTRSVQGGIEVRVGTGERLGDGGVAFTYADRLTPPTVHASVGAPHDIGTDVRLPFATVEAVSWSLEVAWGQLLEIRNARISGSLDGEGLPVSDDAPGGHIEGCFTQAAAEQIYIEALGVTFADLLASTPLDTDCAGSGALDGWAFEAWFVAGEVVELQEASAADGG